MQPIDMESYATIRDSITLGDQLTILTAGDEVVELVVPEITSTGFGGDGEFVAYEAMRDVRRKQFNVIATVGTVVVTGALVAITLGSSGAVAPVVY